MNYDDALRYLVAGWRVRRRSWPSLALGIGFEESVDWIFQVRVWSSPVTASHEPFLAIASRGSVRPWEPSADDAQATDWIATSGQCGSRMVGFERGDMERGAAQPSPAQAAATIQHLTDGERRVSVRFNPSALPEVDATKFTIAGLIDVMLAIAADRSHPGARAAALAATKLEEACMWQVKALTAAQTE